MGIARASTIIIGPNDVDSLLQSFGRGAERGRALRARLAEQFPGRPDEEIEDAVQTACECFLDEADGTFEPAAAYAWIRNAAYHSLIREVKRQKRVIAVDPTAGALKKAVSEQAGPAAELIALKDELDVELLVGEFAESLPAGRRQILALWGAGHKRPQDRLSTRDQRARREALDRGDGAGGPSRSCGGSRRGLREG